MDEEMNLLVAKILLTNKVVSGLQDRLADGGFKTSALMRVWTYIPYPHLIFNLNQ